MKYLIILIILIQINIGILNGFSITGRCGRPSVPTNAKLLQISAERVRFDDNENVNVLCELNQFPNHEQSLHCIKGHWGGKRSRCAKKLVANVVQVQVHDCDSHRSIELLNTLIHQSAEGKYPLPPNAYHSSRHNESVTVEGSYCYNWKIRLDRKVKIAHLVLDFFTNVNSSNSTSKAQFTIQPNVGKYRTCQLEKVKTDLIENDIISGWYYYCDLNSENDYTNELNNLTSEIVFTMNSSNKREIGLDAVFIGGIYTTGNESDPKSVRPNCGDIEIPVGVMIQQELTFYNIRCNDSFYDYHLKPNYKYKIMCGYNGQWTGEWPKCIPIVTCPGLSKLNEEIDSSIEIEEIGNVYYLNDTQWYAINESWVKYRCVNDNEIMVGRSSRVCDKKGKWTYKPPHCSSTGVSGFAIAGILIVLLIIIILSILILLKFFVRRVKKDLRETCNEIEESHRKRISEDFYADINSEFFDNPDDCRKSCSANYESVSYDPIAHPRYETGPLSRDLRAEPEYLDMLIVKP